MKFAFLATWGASALLAGCGAAVASTPVAVVLLSDVVLDHARITLSDLAYFEPEGAVPLADMEVGRAPRVSYTGRFSRAELERLIRRRAPGLSIAWSGAPAVTVHTLSQTIEERQIRDAVLLRLRADLADGACEISVAGPLAPVEIPFGAYRLVVRPIAAASMAPHISVWVDVLVDGAVYRSIVLPAALTSLREVFVAGRAIDAGVTPSSDDFVVRRENVVGIAPVRVAGNMLSEGARLRHALREGQVLTDNALAVSGAVFRGDHVRLLYSAAGIGIEADAVAQANAVPGDHVAVRTSANSETLTGRLTRSGAVLIE